MRLAKQNDISSVFEEGTKSGDGLLQVFAKPSDLGHLRVCIIVSKRNWGKKAVVRNRVKRLLREAVRLSQRSLDPGKDFIIIARRRDEVPSLDEYQKSVRKLLRATKT
ncbi:MAG: ribonuclease P protein component [Planctomycetes bacterium]|nr:ribonuclease P protein component [Planctomycetota bacterium]